MKDLNIQWILLGNEDPSQRKKGPQRITWTRNDQLSFCRALLLVSPHFLPFQAKSRKFTYFRISCFWEHSQLIDSVVLYPSPIFATYMVRATGPKSLTGLFVVLINETKRKKATSRASSSNTNFRHAKWIIPRAAAGQQRFGLFGILCRTPRGGQPPLRVRGDAQNKRRGEPNGPRYNSHNVYFSFPLFLFSFWYEFQEKEGNNLLLLWLLSLLFLATVCLALPGNTPDVRYTTSSI